jgi:methylmalonyl-CoA mutase N-terminal domain/subunit
MNKAGGDAGDRLSPSGIPLKEAYRPSDSPVDYTSDLNDPGSWPFTRGVQPSMYRGRLWTMRQYAGFGTARETNERFRHLLSAGQTGLSVAFDLPTQMGLDSDSPRSLGEVGRAGVAIDTVEDMHQLLDALPLESVSTSMTINATAATLLAMYIVVAEERGIARSAISGTIQNDIL